MSRIAQLIQAFRLKAGSQGSAMSRKAVWLAGMMGVAVLALPATASAAACGNTWGGPAEGSWGTPANWSAGHVPTSSEVACIGSGVTVEASFANYQVGVVQGEGSLVVYAGTFEVTDALEPSVIGSLTMKYEAVLTGAATVEVLGSLSWGAASTMSGTGMTVVESGALGSVSSSVDLVGRTFINDGTLTYAGGSLVMSEGAQLDNSGTFDATAEGAAFANGDKGAAPLVVNTGTFEKTENTERTKVEVDFENSGKITTTTGRFAFGGSEVAVTLANGSVLEGTEVFDQAAVTAGDFKAPAGKVTLEYGSLDIAEGDTATINNFTMNFNAEVKGAGTLELPEDFTWALGSTMSGSGTTVVESGASASVVGAEARLVGRKFVNEGTFTLESGEMRMTDGARFENNGTFNANAEGTFDMYTNNESTAPLFVNTGTFQKTAGTGQTNVEFPFENIGVVDAKTGKIGFLKTEALVYFAKGSILEGSIVIDAAQVNAGSFKATGTVTLEYSVLAVEAGSTATIADFIMNNGCEVAGAGTLAISESFSWDVQSKMSGTGATVIEPGATGSITVGGATAKIIERDLVNEGTFTWAEGELAMSYGARLENRGTFDANSENAQGIFEPENEREGAAPLVVNSGTFQKTKGTGETKVEVDFENLGSILQPTGKLLIKHPVTAESSTQYGGKNESALGPPPPGCGDPIDCATGNFYESQTDLAVGGRGIGLTLTRTYNSQAAAAGASGTFGSGWSSPFSDYLTVGQGKTTLTQANGSTVPFTEGKGEAFTPRAWSQDTLSGNSKAGYSLVLPNQLKYQFEGATGRLQSVSDRNGNQTKLGYGKTGLLETITDPSGRKITLTYNKEGLVESAKDPTGHTAKYEYEEGNLKSVTLPGETKARWQYHYGEAHQMTLMIDGRKGETTNEYNAAHQLTSQTDPAGHKLKFEYEPFHTKITSNTTGAVTDEHFTSNNKPYSITHGFGTSSASTETLTYDADGDLTSVTDGNGHKASYTYENGNKTSMVNADKDETKWTYDGTHDVLTVTTPNGEKTTITRNSDGDAETVSRPAPGNTTQTTTYHYDEHGNLTSVVDPLKHTWSYEYDPAGDRTSETDPEGDKRTYDYNEDSQETSTVSPGGNVKGAEASQYTTKIERDQQGRPTLITDPLGHTTKYVYDGNGNIETMTDGDGNTTTYTYDADNEPTKVKEPNGDVTETGYDGAERVTSQTDGNKHTTTYVRNVLGEVTEIKDPLGRVTKKECDAAGNLTAVIDAAGRTTKYAYDPANRLKEISYSESKTPTVKYEYDADGNRVKMVDGTGTTTYTYDILDRLIKSTNGRGVATGYEYNIGDEQVKLTYPNNDPLTRAYDNAGRLQSATDWSGNTTTFAYNPDSDLSTITYPKGTGEQDKMTYNGADQELKITMTGSGLKVLASLAYTRDGNGQVKTTTTTGLPGTASISDTYDANNRLGKSGSTTYAYDAADEPTTLGSNTSVYDAAGELKASGSDIYGYDQVGDRGSATPKEGQATAYGYNQAGDLIQVKQGKTSGLNDTYAYNGDGLRTSQSKGKGTSYVTWDNQVELPLILNDEQNSYVYGPDNIPIEEIQSKGVVLYLHHDQQGSTRMLTSATGAVEATTTYDAYGNVTGTTGTATTPLGYDGQYTDTDTGLIYMRARAYDPATAQFLRVDPLVGLTRAPYDYAEDNPLTESDPSGLCGVSSLGEFGDCFNPVSSGNLAYEGAEELSSATDGTINLPSLLIRPPVIDAGALIVCAVPYSDFACPEALGAAWSDSTSSVIATGIETNWCEPTKLAAEEAVNSLLLSFGGLGVYAAQAAAEQGATRLALALIRGTPLTIQGILDAALAKHSG